MREQTENSHGDGHDAADVARTQLAMLQQVIVLGTMDVTVRNGSIARISGNYLRLHGLPDATQEETRDTWLARIHPEDRERADATMQAAMRGEGAMYENEYRIHRADDGSVRWMR